MQFIKVDVLKSHPLNTYFFDDMEGQKWNEFKESIKTSGVIEPIVCTKGTTIISGHQRVRACRELGIAEVMCEIRNLDDDADTDEITKQLIETNIRQRGNINCSAMQMSRIIEALEPFYGIKHGNNQHTEDANNVGKLIKTQDELAAELGINMETYRLYKKVGDLIPEIQELVETGDMSFSVASRIVSRLTPEDQKALSDVLPVGEKVTAEITKQYIALLTQKEHEAEKKDAEIKKLRAEKEELQNLDLDKEKELDEIDERNVRRIEDLEALLAEEKAKTDLNLIDKIKDLEGKYRSVYEKSEEHRANAAKYKDAYDKVSKQLSESKVSDEINDLVDQVGGLEEEVDKKDAIIADLRKQLENDGIMKPQTEFTIYRLSDIAVNVSGECYAYSSMFEDDYLDVSLDDLLSTREKIKTAIDGLDGLSKRISERIIQINKSNTKGVA